ncbi:MAG: hypothetical protein ACAH83_18490 [Alphaproteobacteria bacterium]
MKTLLLIPVFVLMFSLNAHASASADQKLPPMMSGTEMPHLPDTVTPDGMHIGHWSAGDAKAAAQAKAAQPAPLANPAPAANAVPAAQAAPAAKSAPADSGMQQSMTVTSIQTCYDQLDPADVAEIKREYTKPYAECQMRLEAKLQGKREMKAGEAAAAQTPESPRNYMRVQQPEPAVANSAEKSAVKTNP